MEQKETAYRLVESYLNTNGGASTEQALINHIMKRWEKELAASVNYPKIAEALSNDEKGRFIIDEEGNIATNNSMNRRSEGTKEVVDAIFSSRLCGSPEKAHLIQSRDDAPMKTLQQRVELLIKEVRLKDDMIQLKEEIVQNLRQECKESEKLREQNEILEKQLAQKEEKEKMICSICLDDLDSKTIEVVLRCGHRFHFSCFEKYKGDSCPLCRRPLR